MREILFRGQIRKKGEMVRLDGTPVDSKWIYGGIFAANIKSVEQIITSYADFKKYPVYAETVGQYTGLTDKSGTKIFEGDICDFTVFNYDGRDTQLRGVVTYNGSGFILSDGKEKKDFVFELDYALLNGDGFEVIGNIYDNPELLKGE